MKKSLIKAVVAVSCFLAASSFVGANTVNAMENGPMLQQQQQVTAYEALDAADQFGRNCFWDFDSVGDEYWYEQHIDDMNRWLDTVNEFLGQNQGLNNEETRNIVEKIVDKMFGSVNTYFLYNSGQKYYTGPRINPFAERLKSFSYYGNRTFRSDSLNQKYDEFKQKILQLRNRVRNFGVDTKLIDDYAKSF